MGRIVLQPPYAKDWRIGYLQYNRSEGRRSITLYNSSEDRSVVNYARYLYEVKIGRYLRKDEHVDHINENKLVDSVENLQVLLSAMNIAKGNSNRGRVRRFEYV